MNQQNAWPMAVLLLFMLVSLAACSDSSREPAVGQQSTAPDLVLDLYKSPACGCCEGWAQHIESAGIGTAVHHPEDLNSVKTERGIAPRYQSCHTAVSAQGYVFEGHIPAYLIRRFLANPPPESIGLSVPGMPVGSPGMEMGDRFQAYEVVLLKRDGSSEVYERIQSARQQYQ